MLLIPNVKVEGDVADTEPIKVEGEDGGTGNVPLEDDLRKVEGDCSWYRQWTTGRRTPQSRR